MKTRTLLSAAAITAVLTVVFMGLTACEASFPEHIRADDRVKLLSLTLQPVDFNAQGLPIDRPGVDPLEVAGEEIPKPVIEEDWDDSGYSLAEADLVQVWFLKEEHVETVRIKYTAVPGTVVSWGVGTAGSRPEEFSGAPLELHDQDVVYIRVSTLDGVLRSYYRVYARLASPTSLLSLITVADRDTKINPPADGRNNWDGDPEDPTAETARGDAPFLSISITNPEGHGGANILATKLNEYATIKYAKIDHDTDVSTVDYAQLVFVDGEDLKIEVPAVEADAEPTVYWGKNLKFNDQDVLVAEVTAHNTFDKYYYKFRVSVGRIVNIKSLTMNTVAKKPGGNVPVESVPVLALGVPNPTWTDIVSGTFATAAAVPNFEMELELEDAEGSYEFIRLLEAETSEPGSFTGAGAISFNNKDQLAIKVKSAAETSPGNPIVYTYYKVRVDLQAAIIRVQPKNNVYVIRSHTYPATPVQVKIGDDTVTENRILITATGNRTLDKAIEPLEAVLDRDGTFTYQWYTANSWYGGYGFDKDGRVSGDTGFIADFYHGEALDEKNNVSLFNGGSGEEKKWYKLPTAAYRDGWLEDPDYEAYAISGANAKTYTPEITAKQRPFISGYSSQSQYYWVVITDAGGREVISERATIVAEWGQAFNRGVPGAKVNKKHHIVDLYAYLDYEDWSGAKKAARGMYAMKPINDRPFRAGNHGDKFLFPINFPSGFDVMDYTIAICQAKFYLADGTVWIQNWTQGDVGFERNGEGQVLYYNLTNNNASLGLSGDSKEPQGANLTETPTHVVIKPAGTKSVNERPPFKSDGKSPDYSVDGDAQGWFTPYIEIVELRFEGPARSR